MTAPWGPILPLAAPRAHKPSRAAELEGRVSGSWGLEPQLRHCHLPHVLSHTEGSTFVSRVAVTMRSSIRHIIDTPNAGGAGGGGGKPEQEE